MVNDKKVVAIIQARMGSTRLPGKVLKSICGKPMLLHICKRLSNVSDINQIVIATSNLKIDDPIYEMSKMYDIGCFRGSESDVLNRFFLAAKNNYADHIIRITGDCPLVDHLIIEKLIKFYFEGLYDFCGIACGAGVHNQKNINRFPDGFDAEIFSYDVLSQANKEAKKKLQREHVTPFIWKNKERYKINTLYSENDYSDYRFTVDNQEDFEYINWIYESLFHLNPNFHLNDIIEMINSNFKKAKNNKYIGKEGYDEFWK